MCIHTYIYTHTHIYIYIYIHIYVYMNIHIYAHTVRWCMNTRIYIQMVRWCKRKKTHSVRCCVNSSWQMLCKDLRSCPCNVTPRFFASLCRYATQCNSLQHTATHCNILQRHVLLRRISLQVCNTYQRTHYTTTPRLASSYFLASMRHTTTHCNTQQLTATHCNTLQHTKTHCNIMQHTSMPCLASSPLPPCRYAKLINT